MSDPTCADRINEHRLSRSAFVDECLSVIEGDESSDDQIEEADEMLWDMPLSIETLSTVRVTFSTGGPADGIEIVHDSDGYIRNVTYWFQDWFDGAELPVKEDSPLWRYAEQIVEVEMM